MKRRLLLIKIIFLGLLLFAFILVIVSIPIVVTTYIYFATEDYPLVVRLPIIVLLGGFSFLMTYLGLKKGFSKKKKKNAPESKLP
ncbi:hypothetical protein COU96_01720 [Candidatus Shapirobacteria bacterium CG10_big_fil_rev_8_21_14_0_10_38_14]|uniref:Uncharacterized protein n=1 Tax=Candidatus Shapirobacteria bacterium CG10_big_fil_rev_8_21_14_0_10_38_14 TaxID=1974483 RepID=A0A2M8L5K3_9BACT|nr:MAG: hypothetical protein COU96_01720 [Candidatus Shapirobacteria bacterium CG10_big_fil_rev_8_21_14_0_10_38_14]